MKSRPIAIAACFAAAVLGVACGDDPAPPPKTPPPAPAPAPAPEPAPAPAPPPAPAEAPPDAPAPTSDSIGVPECDAHLALLMQCIVNAPPEARSAMFARVESARADWKAKAKELDRDELATSCRQAREALAAGGVCKSAP